MGSTPTGDSCRLVYTPASEFRYTYPPLPMIHSTIIMYSLASFREPRQEECPIAWTSWSPRGNCVGLSSS